MSDRKKTPLSDREKTPGAVELEDREFASSVCYLDELTKEERRVGKQPLIIYHNPRCTKSRETLALIRESGIEPRVVEYLKTPPSEGDLAAIVQKLRITPERLVRKNEALFVEKYAGKKLTDMQWLEAMARDPILIERPIVIRGDEAAIGRPPENVKRLLT
jgi:arsenate reductase